jgi:hypothetical protein
MLTAAEVEAFALEGYVVKRGLIGQDLLATVVDLIWDYLPPDFRRDDPETWRAPVSDCRGSQDISERFGLVKFRNEIQHEAAVRRLTIGNDALLQCAEQLLGRGNARMPRKFRGLYPIFPTPEHADVPINAHIDVTPNEFRLSVGVYVADVPPRGGGLAVWPRSHRSLHFETRSTGCTFDDLSTDGFLAAFRAWNRTEPVELPGKAGDVVFFHSRLLHGPSLNLINGHVRLAAYFNILGAEDSRTAPVGLWEGWRGVQSLHADPVRRSSTEPLPAPGPERASPRRSRLPVGGAWSSFASALRTATGRARVAANAGSHM